MSLETNFAAGLTKGVNYNKNYTNPLYINDCFQNLNCRGFSDIDINIIENS